MGCCFSVDGIFCSCARGRGGSETSIRLRWGKKTKSKKTAHVCTDLDVGHGEYPDAAPELSLVPVVVYLPDDVHGVALLKRQLPAEHMFSQRRQSVEKMKTCRKEAVENSSHQSQSQRRSAVAMHTSERPTQDRQTRASHIHATHLAD